MITTTKVESFFDSIRDKDIESYNDYWGELKPQSNNAAFRRYLFAFMSVNTSWKNNCKGYNAIKQFGKWTLEKTNQLELWNYNADTLFSTIEATRVGMQNNRTITLGLLVISFGGILTITCAVLMAKDGLNGAIDWLKKFLG